MEIMAALEALRVLVPEAPSGIEVVSDSTYVVKCFSDRWWQGWLRKGWKNSQGKPVANRDLWEPLFGLVLEGPVPVTFRWVKGHSGDRWNDRVDELATMAADRGVGESG
jgi:ribonuclease HI